VRLPAAFAMLSAVVVMQLRMFVAWAAQMGDSRKAWPCDTGCMSVPPLHESMMGTVRNKLIAYCFPLSGGALATHPQRPSIWAWSTNDACQAGGAGAARRA
jgi:hypothetical protein